MTNKYNQDIFPGGFPDDTIKAAKKDYDMYRSIFRVIYLLTEEESFSIENILNRKEEKK